MNVLVVSSNRLRQPVAVMPFGACMAAEAAESAGHNVSFLDLMFKRGPLRELEREIKKSAPGVIGISVRNIDNNDSKNTQWYINDIKALVERSRQTCGAPVVLGGAALSIMPEEIIKMTGADCAVTGNGAQVFPKIISDISRGSKINSLVRSHAAAGESCISPDFSRWLDIPAYRSMMSPVPIQSKRGCPFSCVYCTYGISEGTGYQLTNPRTVVDSIKRYVSEGFKEFEFVDNVFNAPYAHAASICEEIARSRVNARFSTIEINPAFVDDQLLNLMKTSGFSSIGITAESASDKVLTKLSKNYLSPQVYRAAECVSRSSLPCLWIFMLGAPGETKQTVEETFEFARKYIRPSDCAFFGTGVRIYPGTGLEKIAREEGALNLPREKMLEPLFYVSPQVDINWLREKVLSEMSLHYNYLSSDSFGLPLLPAFHRVASFLRLSPPLWKYTPYIRRLGVKA